MWRSKARQTTCKRTTHASPLQVHRPSPRRVAPRSLGILPTLQERTTQAGLELKIEGLHLHTATAVLAEPATLSRILLNLVDNACKYGAAPLVLTFTSQPRHLLLRLSDGGPGLTPAARRRIFRPFHRAAHDAAGKTPGVGLGLSLARHLARAQGGELRCLDTPRGATFELRLRRVV